MGKQQAYPILIKGLHRLEYRGYDSAGLALVNREGVLNVFKSKGKVADLEHFVESKDLDGTIGIAHTRWATHGEPNDINAHPHYSDSGNIALIHNGIIENYRVLKEALIENGYTFKSDTDTEVLVNLIEYIRTSNNCTLLEAVQQALKQVIGAYAIAVVEKGNQDQIIAARRSSPMVIGIGDKEFFLASDAASIVEYTDKIVYVNDGEVVVMDRNHPLKIVTLDNQESKIDIKKLQLSISQLEKGGYPHFMLKEIFEQPKTIVDCIRGRINPETYDVILSGIMDNRERFLNARRIIFVACGTSWHASLIGEYLIEDFCRIPVEVEYASEFRYRNPILNKDDLVIVVSQSGETADTLAGLRLAKEQGVKTMGIVNVVGSSIARESDYVLYTAAGPEIAVASTKAYTTQLSVFYLVVAKMALLRGVYTEEQTKSFIAELERVPEVMQKVLEKRRDIHVIAKKILEAKDLFMIGRGLDYSILLEGSLKLKEVSYIHSEAYASGELKHGPIALITTNTPVVATVTQEKLMSKELSNIKEVKSRGADIVLFIKEALSGDLDTEYQVIKLPDMQDEFMVLPASVALQLLAYYVSSDKGFDVDKPRNLAKVVTVE